jgi:biopolymer transport protein ExbB/TolQ
MSFQLVHVSGHHAPGLMLVNIVLLVMAVTALSIVLGRIAILLTGTATAKVMEARRMGLREGLSRSVQRRAMERSVRRRCHELSRGTRGLLSIGVTAPLVGLMGSVSVGLNLFRAWALTGGGYGPWILAAVAEALVPLWTGLAIGLFAIWGRAFLMGWVARTRLHMCRPLVYDSVDLSKSN